MLKTAIPTTGYRPGQYVKVGKMKGYVVDCADGVKILPTKGGMGIQTVDPRFHDIKIIRDRSPEGIEETRKQIKKLNVQVAVYSLVPLSIYIGFATTPLIGIGLMGLVLITAAYFDEP